MAITEENQAAIFGHGLTETAFEAMFPAGILCRRSLSVSR